MALTESLTVQILGDSSQLQQELDQVAGMLEGLQDLLSQATQGTSQLGSTFQSLSSALGPLQNISSQLSLVSQQVQTLSQQSVTLNVAPAIQALEQLLQTAQAAAQQLAALSMSIGGGGAVMSEVMTTMGYADGGLVSGPSGVDQVPARLSAGEFVLSREAVAAIGVPALDHFNQTGELAALTSGQAGGSSVGVAAAPPAASFRSPWQNTAVSDGAAMSKSGSLGRPEASGSQMTTNQFGGIEIHVRESADVGLMLKNLQNETIGLRNRRG